MSAQAESPIVCEYSFYDPEASELNVSARGLPRDFDDIVSDGSIYSPAPSVTNVSFDDMEGSMYAVVPSETIVSLENVDFDDSDSFEDWEDGFEDSFDESDYSFYEMPDEETFVEMYTGYDAAMGGNAVWKCTNIRTTRRRRTNGDLHFVAGGRKNGLERVLYWQNGGKITIIDGRESPEGIEPRYLSMTNKVGDQKPHFLEKFEQFRAVIDYDYHTWNGQQKLGEATGYEGKLIILAVKEQGAASESGLLKAFLLLANALNDGELDFSGTLSLVYSSDAELGHKIEISSLDEITGELLTAIFNVLERKLAKDIFKRIFVRITTDVASFLHDDARDQAFEVQEAMLADYEDSV